MQSDYDPDYTAVTHLNSVIYGIAHRRKITPLREQTPKPAAAFVHKVLMKEQGTYIIEAKTVMTL